MIFVLMYVPISWYHFHLWHFHSNLCDFKGIGQTIGWSVCVSKYKDEIISITAKILIIAQNYIMSSFYGHLCILAFGRALDHNQISSNFPI